MSNTEEDDVPYYLMPIAAILGIYVAVSSIKAVYQIYRSVTRKTTDKSSLYTRQFVQLVGSIVVAVLLYGMVCARVQNTIMTALDPYELLNVEYGETNVTHIKHMYRSLSKVVHPDKPNGDASKFHELNVAYRALTEDAEQYRLYGHPDGPQTQLLNFAIPQWLLFPTGTVAIVLVLLYLATIVYIGYYLVQYVKNASQKQEGRSDLQDNTVASADLQYLGKHLRPDSSPLHILFYLCTTPESLKLTQLHMNKANELIAQRKAFLESSKNTTNNTDVLDDDGWASSDDEEDDANEEAVKLKEEARKARKAKEDLAKQVAVAAGKVNAAEHVKIEGLDDGVLGQQWVERTMADHGLWPPPFVQKEGLDSLKFDGKSVMEHKAARRNLCMVIGRLNAQTLNNHPQLVEAGQSNLVDPTYFRATLEFRQRLGLLLEAALRVAAAGKSYRLYKTIVETAAMFKIGTTSATNKKTVKWFQSIMLRMYGGPAGVPKLVVGDEKLLSTPGEDNIATDDVMVLELQVERAHAENFTKQKIEMAMKQGVHPQVVVNSYREGWWVLVRAKRMNSNDADNNDAEGKEENQTDKNKKDTTSKKTLMDIMDEESLEIFEKETEENRLLTSWPFIVTDLRQKKGSVKVRFQAPSKPGQYKFMVDVKSMEFLGCDLSFNIDKTVLDKKDVERKEEEGTEVELEEEESKKTK